MSKKAPKTYEEQLNILKSRNLKILNERKAKKILSIESYYALINGYKDIFLESFKSEIYQENVYFENIFMLFNFDRELRMILLKYILIVERTIKTKISYHFSMKYDDKYLNANNFDYNNRRKSLQILRLIYNMSKVKRIYSEVNSSIYHYQKIHDKIPLWVLVEKLNFGIISHFFYCLI